MEDLRIDADAEVGMVGANLLDHAEAEGHDLRVADLDDVDDVGKLVDDVQDLEVLAVVDGELQLHGKPPSGEKRCARR